jgi:hypothetical protein
MTFVWLVTTSWGGMEWEVDSAWSSEELAEARKRGLDQTRPKSEDHDVEVFPLDSVRGG